MALEYRMKQRKNKRVLPVKCAGKSKHSLPTTQETTYRHHQMVSTEIRLIIFFVAKIEGLYTVSKNKIRS